MQFRRFYYDSLSRLIYANNPEQNATIAFNPPGEAGTMWTMKYVYDDNGNLTSRTDARGVTTAYGYDGLNRNTTVNYSNTPSISPDIERYYDTAFNGKGRLQRVVSNLLHPGNGSRVDSQTVINAYDHLGRVVSQTQRFLKPGTSNWLDYFISRTFDLAGNLTSQNNPEFGRTVSYSYGANGRLSNFSGNLGDPLGFSSVYTDQFEYSAAGQMTKERLGTGIPLYHHSKYNSRHQMVETSVGTSSSAVQTGAWDRGRLLFFYNAAAMTAGDPSVEGSGNNGNVLRQEHWVPTSVSNQYAVPMRDDYEYDPINRITKVKGRQRTAATFPGQGTLQDIYQQAYSYDKFGNRKLDMTQTWGTGINGSVAADIYDVDKPTNRLKGMIYDAAGNLVKTKPISPQPENRVYDAENRMITATLGATSHYVYDGDGRRVRRILPTGEFWQVYGIDGELLAEYQWNSSTSTASLKKEYGYRDGQLLVVADPTEPNANKRVQWLIADHLGTPRMVVDKTGSLSGVTRHDYLPFGEELVPNMGVSNSVRQPGLGYSGDLIRQKFTSQERDSETGLDFFLSRNYSSTQGRFTKPDSFGGRRANPQTFNLYGYVINNPLKYNDPTGHFQQDPRKKDKEAPIIGTGDNGEPIYDCQCSEQMPTETAIPHPSLVESIIPVWGSGKEAWNNFRTGHPWKGAGYTVLAITDVALIKSAAVGVFKIGTKVFGTEVAEKIATEALLESDVILFHGTDILSAERFLAGEGLDAAKAAALKIDGPSGFFLATDASDAAYFAARRGTGAVLEFRFSPTAAEALGGLPTTPLGALGRYGRFSGGESIISIRSFEKFNALRESGHITIIPR